MCVILLSSILCYGAYRLSEKFHEGEARAKNGTIENLEQQLKGITPHSQSVVHERQLALKRDAEVRSAGLLKELKESGAQYDADLGGKKWNGRRIELNGEIQEWKRKFATEGVYSDRNELDNILWHLGHSPADSKILEMLAREIESMAKQLPKKP